MNLLFEARDYAKIEEDIKNIISNSAFANNISHCYDTIEHCMKDLIFIFVQMEHNNKYFKHLTRDCKNQKFTHWTNWLSNPFLVKMLATGLRVAKGDDDSSDILDISTGFSDTTPVFENENVKIYLPETAADGLALIYKLWINTNPKNFSPQWCTLSSHGNRTNKFPKLDYEYVKTYFENSCEMLIFVKTETGWKPEWSVDLKLTKNDEGAYELISKEATSFTQSKNCTRITWGYYAEELEHFVISDNDTLSSDIMNDLHVANVPIAKLFATLIKSGTIQNKIASYINSVRSAIGDKIDEMPTYTLFDHIMEVIEQSNASNVTLTDIKFATGHTVEVNKEVDYKHYLYMQAIDTIYIDIFKISNINTLYFNKVECKNCEINGGEATDKYTINNLNLPVITLRLKMDNVKVGDGESSMDLSKCRAKVVKFSNVDCGTLTIPTSCTECSILYGSVKKIILRGHGLAELSVCECNELTDIITDETEWYAITGMFLGDLPKLRNMPRSSWSRSVIIKNINMEDLSSMPDYIEQSLALMRLPNLKSLNGINEDKIELKKLKISDCNMLTDFSAIHDKLEVDVWPFNNKPDKTIQNNINAYLQNKSKPALNGPKTYAQYVTKQNK